MENGTIQTTRRRNKVKLPKKLKRGLIGVGTLGLIILMLGSSMIGSNDAGYYKIKQGRVSGELSVVEKAGWHLQNFAKETTYAKSDTYYFSKSDLDGGAGAEAQAINVIFCGGGKAEVDGSVKYKLPMAEDKRIKLHDEFRSYKAIQNDLIRQYSAQALKNTSAMFKPKDTYSGQRGVFNQLFEEQLREGIYQTKSKQTQITDQDGNIINDTVVEICKDRDGNPLIAVPSPFKKYGVELLAVSIKDIDYDDTIDKLIAQQKEAEQQKSLAKTLAEKAKQEAIKAEEEGKAKIAQAKAEEEVKKQRSVTEAEKNKAVAVLNAQQEKEVAALNKEKAELEAKALLTKKEAEAKANKLLVQAGLTPKEKAEIEMKTKIGVASELSKVNVPEIMIGGSENGTSPMDAISINMLMDIIDKMDKQNP